MPLDQLLVGMLWALYPLWLAAGWLDYRCHRATDLPHASGVAESALHLAMLVEVGAGLLAPLLLEVTGAVLAGMWGLVVLHFATSIADTRVADGRRRIGVLEQHVHGVLDMMPLMGTAIATVLHWDAVRAALSGAPGAFALRWRDPPLSGWVLAAVLVPAVAFAIVPGVREFAAARRAARMAPRATPR
jgi:hypothetical protein